MESIDYIKNMRKGVKMVKATEELQSMGYSCETLDDIRRESDRIVKALKAMSCIPGDVVLANVNNPYKLAAMIANKEEK